MPSEVVKKNGAHRQDVREWMGIREAPRCCYTCIHYHSEGQYCDHFQDSPPVGFLETGCADWKEGVPF